MSILDKLEGRFVGSLDDEERWLFEKALEDNLVEEDYDSGAGFFLGLSKIKVIRQVKYPIRG